MGKECYFGELGYCDYTEGLWQCQYCKEWFCHYHWHQTYLGRNVECAACEYNRVWIEDGDECPLCESGTVEIIDGEARCRGECGNTWPVNEP